MLERRAREQIADAGAQRTVHRSLEIFADLARRAFRGLERDIAGKAFGDDDVDLAAADIVAFDKTLIVEIGQVFFAQDAAGLAHLFETLGLFDADIEKAHGRPRQAEQDPRGGGAHDGEIDQVFGIGADRGADIEHDRLAAQRRPQRRDRRPLDTGQAS